MRVTGEGQVPAQESDGDVCVALTCGVFVFVHITTWFRLQVSIRRMRTCCLVVPWLHWLAQHTQ